jgi:glutamyl-tRNA reductase
MAKLIHEQTAPTQIVLDLDKINMDEFSWGDLEDMESNSPTKIRQMMEKFAIVEGISKEEMTQFFRQLSLRQMRELSEQFRAAVMQMANPVAKNGKN